MVKSRAVSLAFGMALIMTGIICDVSAKAQNQSPPQTTQPSQSANPPAKKKHAAPPPMPIHLKGLNYTEELPTNFPVPPYTSNVTKTKFINSTAGNPYAAAFIITKDEPDQVYKWYLLAMTRAGFAVKVPSEKGAAAMFKKSKAYVIQASKDRQRLNVFCLKNRHGAGTDVDISFYLSR